MDKNNQINKEIKETEKTMQVLEKLSKSFASQFKQAADSLRKWTSAATAVTAAINKTKESITELKGIDTIITEISKNNSSLTKNQLKAIGHSSIEAASRYGKKPTEYLEEIKTATSEGYTNPEEIAQLSAAAQTAGNITSELANQYITATDKAYKLGGSIEKLTQILDGSNNITNHNAVNMTELAEGMTEIGATASALGINANEATAALGTIITATHQGGEEAAQTFKSLLLNISQLTDEKQGIDAEGLTKYENACSALGIKLKETKNGILSLRDPMEILKEISTEYNKLEDADPRKTELLNSISGSINPEQMDALMKQWGNYDTMLQQYNSGAGSIAADVEKKANSWETSMTRLSNTWTETVGNIADSNAITTGVNSLNSLLTVINTITEKLGAMGTIGIGAGLLASFKNVGREKTYSLIS